MSFDRVTSIFFCFAQVDHLPQNLKAGENQEVRRERVERRWEVEGKWTCKKEAKNSLSLCEGWTCIPSCFPKVMFSTIVEHMRLIQ